MSESYDKETLLELAARFVDGHSTADDAAKLEGLLRSGESARKAFARYLAIHGQLASTSLVLNSIERAAANEQPTPVPPTPRSTAANPRTTARKGRRHLLFALIVACVAFVFIIGLGLGERASQQIAESPTPESFSTSDYDDTPIEMHPVAFFAEDQSRPVVRSTLNGGLHRLLTTLGGVELRPGEQARITLTGPSNAILHSGSLRVSTHGADEEFAVEMPNFRIASRNSDFRIAYLDRTTIEITAIKGSVELQRPERDPRYIWQFNNVVDGQIMDRAGSLPANVPQSVERAQSPNGRMALRFTNQESQAVEIPSDSALSPGEGPFACSSGISIEAVIVSNWTGAYRDYDEIFRKEDGPYRMLLSFQNDINNREIPRVADGPVLSFGLHLDGSGYSELDMPLDGADGRPTIGELVDGRPHHIAATYDAFSGWKALYIDGRLRFSHRFEPGSVIISGGPAPAVIGNWRNREPFNGLIDTIAFFDFALSAQEIASRAKSLLTDDEHLAPSSENLDSPRWTTTDRIEVGSSRLLSVDDRSEMYGTH